MDDAGLTLALVAAAGTGRVESVEYLLQSVTNPDAAVGPDGLAETALLVAAESGHEAVVRALLDGGASAHPEAYVDCRATPLEAAARSGHEPVVSMLLGYGATPEYVAVHAAARSGYGDVVHTLLDTWEWDEEENTSDEEEDTSDEEEDTSDEEEEVPLVGASRLKCKAVAEQLLRAAVISGNAHVVRVLLEYGASVHRPDEKGATPLLVASRRGHEAVVAALLAGGASVDLADRFGETPLLVASERGHEAVVAALLARGASINHNHATGRGNTPLLVASERGHEAVVAALLAGGASVDLADRFGLTPLLVASRGGHEVVVRALLAGGASVDLANRFGETPLEAASCGGHEAVVVALLARGASVDGTDDQRRITPFVGAINRGHMRAASLLHGAGANVQRARASARADALRRYRAYCERRISARYAFLASMRRRERDAQQARGADGRKRRKGAFKGLLTAHLAREVARFL